MLNWHEFLTRTSKNLGFSKGGSACPNALIRSSTGQCYARAVRAAAKAGLGIGVLIWVE